MDDFFKAGLIFFKEEKYLRALKAFQLTIKENPNHHKAWNASGICYFKLKQFQNAMDCFSNAVNLDPNNESYLRNLDKCYKKIPLKTKNHYRSYLFVGIGIICIILISSVVFGLDGGSNQKAVPKNFTTTSNSPTPIMTVVTTLTPIPTPSSIVTQIPTIISIPTEVKPSDADTQLFAKINEGDAKILELWQKLLDDWEKYNLGYDLYYQEILNDLDNIHNTAESYRNAFKSIQISSKYWNYRDNIDDAYRKTSNNAVHLYQMFETMNEKDRKALRNQALGEKAAYEDYIFKSQIELKKL